MTDPKENFEQIFSAIYFHFSQSKDNQMPFTAHFSSKFLLAVISKMLNLIKNNGSCVEYLEIMSKILVNHEFESKTGLPKKKRSVKRKKQKSESYLEVIEENLREPWINCNYIRITCGDINSENIYFFSCGHSHSLNSIKNECKIFEEINNGKFTSNFVEVYEDLINGRINDSSCPACVNNYLR